MSLLYIIIEFSCGQLPWRRITDKEMVRRVKEDFDPVSVLDQLPGPQFTDFVRELERLDYFADPDYELLRRKLLECMEYSGVDDSEPFDWEMPAVSKAPSSVPPTPQKATASTSPRSAFSRRDPQHVAEMMRNIVFKTARNFLSVSIHTSDNIPDAAFLNDNLYFTMNGSTQYNSTEKNNLTKQNKHRKS